jgi:hypothetical protein
MSITHLNRKQKIYYLHQGKTKLDKLKYFFSLKKEGELVESIPDGYEIYENPNAQVFLRKIQPKLITENEIVTVEEGLQNFTKIERYQIEVKKLTISIYTPSQDVSVFSDILSSTTHISGRSKDDIKSIIEQSLYYSSDLRFVLIDIEKRHFQTQRYCYLGSIDDWIDIGSVETLQTLVKTYVKHIGQESFYNLH